MCECEWENKNERCTRTQSDKSRLTNRREMIRYSVERRIILRDVLLVPSTAIVIPTQRRLAHSLFPAREGGGKNYTGKDFFF